MTYINNVTQAHAFIASQWQLAIERGQVAVGWWTLHLNDETIAGWDLTDKIIIPTKYPAFDSMGFYEMATTQAYPCGSVQIVSNYGGG